MIRSSLYIITLGVLIGANLAILFMVAQAIVNVTDVPIVPVLIRVAFIVGLGVLVQMFRRSRVDANGHGQAGPSSP
jgi:hypothetical protein